MTDPTFLGQAGHDGHHPWMTDAACAAHPDPEMWFPNSGNQHDPRIDTALRICRGCPVRQPCLDMAMADLRLEGVWGGTEHRQRRGTRRGNR